MGMADPIPTYTYLVSKLRDSYPDMAYIHVIQPRLFGGSDDPNPHPNQLVVESNDFLRNIWAPRPYISAGGYSSAAQMLEETEKTGDIIAMGRYFISNVSTAQYEVKYLLTPVSH